MHEPRQTRDEWGGGGEGEDDRIGGQKIVNASGIGREEEDEVRLFKYIPRLDYVIFGQYFGCPLSRACPCGADMLLLELNSGVE